VLRYSVDSEYKRLRAVLLSKPHRAIGEVDHPVSVLHQAKVDYSLIKNELSQLAALYRKLKIKVFFIDHRPIKGTDPRYIFNLIFTRDHFLATSRGAIMARMFSEVRVSEVSYACRALKAAGIPIRKTIQAKGTFEGADALWVNSRLVIVGIGRRSNMEAFRQLKAELKQDGVNCVDLACARNSLHLLGSLQFVDADMALIREGSLSRETVSLLRKQMIKTVIIPENSETSQKQAMNFVTIAPRVIIMPGACPRTRRACEKSGVRVLCQAPIFQLLDACGGYACATGILARD